MGKFRAYIDSEITASHTLTTSALRPHFHSGYVIGYLFSGRYHCRLNQKQNFEYGPGEITLLNPGEVHQDFPSKQERDYITVNIQERVFATGLEDFGVRAEALPSFFRPRAQADPQVEEIFTRLRRAIDGHDVEREFVIRGLVTQLALYLAGNFASISYHPKKTELENATTRWEIRRGIEILRDTYTEQFDLGQFARAVGLSKYYLEKVFKKSTGLSPYQFVIQMRVEKAKLLLASTARPITDISMELGFFDQSHFTNSFRHFTGTSPLAYRLATR